MSRQIINIGTGNLTGDGESIRSALDKSNKNFEELFSLTNFNSVTSHIIPSEDEVYDLGSPTNKWKSLYISSSTIYFNTTPLTIQNDVITIGTGSEQINFATEDFVIQQISNIVESDTVFSSSTAASITATDVTNWNTAYSWGDHSAAGYQIFDQDLNTTDNPQFNRIGLTTGELNVVSGTNFSVTVTPDGIETYTLSLTTSGVLAVSGETVFNANIYGGTNNKLWLGGGKSEGTPSLSIPNEVEGTSTYIWIQNQLGGGIKLTTESGDWDFNNDGTLTFPDGTIQSTAVSNSFSSLTLQPYQDVVTTGTTVTFTKTDNGSEVDVIDTNLSITRDAGQQGIYNSALESEPDTYGLSPEGTKWNADGWDDLSDIKTRNYSVFYKALDRAIGNVVVGRELVMFDTINNKYYKIKFSSWTQGGNGGGFSYERTLLNIAPGSQGISVDENKFVIDKTGSIKFSNQYSSNELVSVDLKINSSTLNLSFQPGFTASWNNYLFISNGNSFPRKIVVYDTTTNEEIYSINSPDSTTGLFGNRIYISNNYLLTADRNYNNSTGRLYVYDLSSFNPNSNFDPIYIIDNPNYSGSSTFDSFGTANNIKGNYIVSKGEDVVYIFDITTFTTSTISSANYVLTNPSGNTGDSFGITLYLNENYICVGAFAADDNRNNAGKIYVYDITTFATNIISSANFTIVPNSTILGNNIELYLVGLINNNIFAYDSRNTVYRYDITTFTSNFVDTPTQIIRSYDPNYQYFGYEITYNQNYLIIGDSDNPGNCYVYKLSDILSTTANVRPVITVPGYIRVVTNDNKLYTVPPSLNYFTVYELNSIENSIGINLDSSTTITATNVVNWNTAYSWGDHSQQGYVVSPVSELEFANGTKQTTALNNNNVESTIPLEFPFIINGFKYNDGITAKIGNKVLITNNYIITEKYNLTDNSDVNVGKIFILDKTTLELLYTIYNPNWTSSLYFGITMAVDGNNLVVGVRSYTDAGFTNAGIAYLYKIDTFTSPEIFTPNYTIRNPSPYGTRQTDYFGADVSISNNYIIIGAFGEDSPTVNSGSAYIYDITTFTTSTIETPLYVLDSPTSTVNGYFGQAVSIFGNYAAVSAPQYNIPVSNAGRIYVYDLTTFTTSTITSANYTIGNPNPVFGDYFGDNVKVVDNYILSGVYRKNSSSGEAYVYNILDFTTSTITTPTYTLTNPNIDATSSADQFGFSVSMSGNYIAIGAPQEDNLGTTSGTLYLYDTSTFTTSTISTPNYTLLYPAVSKSLGYFGYSTALLNNDLVVSAPRITTSFAGELYYYNINNFTTSTVSASDNSIDGLTSYTYSTLTAKPSVYGNLLVVGAASTAKDNQPYTGEVYVYDNTTKELLYTLLNPGVIPSYDYFGASTAIYGNYIVVSAWQTEPNNSGVAYVYDITTFTTSTVTAPTYTLTNPNSYNTVNSDNFGYTVGIYNNYICVSAINEDAISGSSSGALYVYDVTTFTTSTVSSATYTLRCPTIFDSNTFNHKFGEKFSIFGNYIVVGVETEAYQLQTNSGMVHVYDISTFTTSTITTPNYSLTPIAPTQGSISSDYFGNSVDISNNYIVVGAYGYTDTSIKNFQIGRVYVYDITTFTTSTITTPTYIIENPYISINSNYNGSLNFGRYVSIKDNYIGISNVFKSTTSEMLLVYDISTFTNNVITNPTYEQQVSNILSSSKHLTLTNNYAFVSVYEFNKNKSIIKRYDLFYSTNVNNVNTINFINTTTNITSSNVVNWNSAYSWGDHNTENYTKFSPVPLASTGTTGDVAGLISADSVYFYYCTGNYDGTTDIWKRTAWSNDTWQQLP